MKRLDLEVQAKPLFGWGWQQSLAKGLGVDDRSVRRWGNEIEVPPYVQAILESLKALREAGLPFPSRWISNDDRKRNRSQIRELCARAFDEYRARCLDNIDRPRRIGSREAFVVADALESQGDVSAFKLGRQIRDLAVRC